jgi:hypothetical protein
LVEHLHLCPSQGLALKEEEEEEEEEEESLIKDLKRYANSLSRGTVQEWGLESSA